MPPVRRSPGQVYNQVAILVSDAIQIWQMFQGPRWGIFSEGGEPIAEADSVIDVEFRKEYRISNYPVEKGAFESYNKVEVPWDAKVTMACGDAGLLSLPGVQTSRRQAFLDAIDAACRSLTFFSVVTPEVTYPSANLIHYNYRRTSRNGASMIEVDVWLQEVRVTASANKFTDTTKSEGATKPTDVGTVQPSTPTVEQSAANPGVFI